MAQDLERHGIAYFPSELPYQRAKFEASLTTSPAPPALAEDTEYQAPAELTVATWNLRFASKAERTLAYLDSARWDVACLQEVGIAASNLLAERDGWSIVNGLRLAWDDGVSSWQAPHGAAIVARNGWQLDRGGAIPDTPTPGAG